MLKNLTVIELANVLAGPAVGMFFAELGAKVIKVENLTTRGDVTRSWKLSGEPEDTDISSYFSSVNWGKKSIAINIAMEEGKKIVHQLVKKADIVLASYKPGDAEKLAMDYQTLSAINRRIIYAHITAFGKEDSRTGYDAILQAASGFTYMNGTPDGPPTKMPVALIDLLSAHQLKEAILVAYIRRLQIGEGSYIHSSLLKTGVASLVNQASNWLMGEHLPERLGSEHPNIAPYGSIFKTRDDKEIVMGVGSDKQFKNLCQVISRPELAAIPFYSSNKQRVKNRNKLNELLAEQIKKFDREELIEKMKKAGVSASGVLNMKEVFQQEAAQQLILKTSENGKAAAVRTVAFESNTINKEFPLSPPPHFNEHNEEVLIKELQYKQERIAELKEAGVLAK